MMMGKQKYSQSHPLAHSLHTWNANPRIAFMKLQEPLVHL